MWKIKQSFTPFSRYFVGSMISNEDNELMRKMLPEMQTMKATAVHSKVFTALFLNTNTLMFASVHI